MCSQLVSLFPKEPKVLYPVKQMIHSGHRLLNQGGHFLDGIIDKNFIINTFDNRIIAPSARFLSASSFTIYFTCCQLRTKGPENVYDLYAKNAIARKRSVSLISLNTSITFLIYNIACLVLRLSPITSGLITAITLSFFACRLLGRIINDDLMEDFGINGTKIVTVEDKNNGTTRCKNVKTYGYRSFNVNNRYAEKNDYPGGYRFLGLFRTVR
jgi:hypothetical protein